MYCAYIIILLSGTCPQKFEVALALLIRQQRALQNMCTQPDAQHIYYYIAGAAAGCIINIADDPYLCCI